LQAEDSLTPISFVAETASWWQNRGLKVSASLARQGLGLHCTPTMVMPPHVLAALRLLQRYVPRVPRLRVPQLSTFIERCSSQIRAAVPHSLVQRRRAPLTRFV
jgi:hypothetical protein